MEKHAPETSKVLLTPRPYYLPGYTGYCPQLKFAMGKTYGQLTAELLSPLEVKQSKPVVPQKDHIPSSEPDTSLTLTCIPDSNLMRIPGYTGFIPRRQNYFACSYSESCRKALADFYQNRRVQKQRQTTDLLAVVNHINRQVEKPKPPLTAISPLKSFTPTGNPNLMDNENPLKYFISGHVPGSRFLIGKGFPVITNQALIQFEGQQQRRRDPMSQGTPGRKYEVTPMPTIYPSDRGMVPSYAGHIPGYRFLYGHTFGRLTENALEKSGINISKNDHC